MQLNIFSQMNYKIIQYLYQLSTTCIYWISKDGSNSESESCKFTEMSRENIKNWHTLDISFVLKLNCDYQFKKLKFKGIYSNEDSVSFLLEKFGKFVYFI